MRRLTCVCAWEDTVKHTYALSAPRICSLGEQSAQTVEARPPREETERRSLVGDGEGLQWGC